MKSFAPVGVHKFGGTSVQSADAMHQVRTIVAGIAKEHQGSPLAVVVSAMGGKPKVTDMLIDSVKAAAVGDTDTCRKLLDQIRTKHVTGIEEMIPGPEHAAERERLVSELNSDLEGIMHLLRAVTLMRSDDPKLVGVISGYGEQWSARMMAALLRATKTEPAGDNWVYLDARSVLVVEDDAMATGVAVMWDESSAKLQAFVEKHPGASLVITGFIASTKDGGITTLGRDGSDYSASVFGRLFEAEEVTIWTDVSGVLSADPRVVSDAYVLPEVSYNEAAELAHFGAKVVHPKTMQPTQARLDWRPDAKSIPIFIRNTFAPKDRGTRIFEVSPLTTCREICGVSAMKDMCLINVMGRGMVGIPGVSSRFFSALHSLGISVTAIAQASSEQSITVALLARDGPRAQQAVREVFRPELTAGHIESVQMVEDVTIIAVVGDGMSHCPGVAGKVMTALGHAGVNIKAIAQGCNETNITTMVDGKHTLRALRAVHAAFLANLTVAVGVIARSTSVANELLGSIKQHAAQSESRFGLKAKVVALLHLPEATNGRTSSIKRVPSESGRLLTAAANKRSSLDLEGWHQALDAEGSAPDLEAFTATMLDADVPMRVVIDASDCDAAAAFHARWLKEGIHVVTNNSAALVGPMPAYRELFKCRGHMTRYVYGTAYGDWLPVASTVTTLISSGDSVKQVEGVLSASVSYVLNRICPAAGGADAAVAFSEAVREALEMGLFEQEPLDDLSGLHSAKQLLCLARDLGYEMEMADIVVEGLVPGGVSDLPTSDAFAQAMSAHDAAFAAKVASARANGNVLRFIARLEHLAATPSKPRATLCLVEVPVSHAFAGLSGSSIAVSFLTQEHGEQPLTISGAISLTSCVNALYSDLIRLARTLDTRARDRGPALLTSQP